MNKKVTYFIISLFVAFTINAQQVIRVGIIGLDTSHSEAFIKLLNAENPESQYEGFKVVAAYPHGSLKIQSSIERIPKYTEVAIGNGVKITESVAELLDMVDCVMLETNDGTRHLEQAVEVIKKGKTLFIDKPVAATLPDVIAIYRFAEEKNVPVFSSSALRYPVINQKLRAGEEGKVVGADFYSPCTEEPSHSNLFWYGIHGVEPLFTVMGKGCETVSCISQPGTTVATGVWEDGRIGTFRGLRDGAKPYGGTVFCEKKMFAGGGYEGYGKLLENILSFFKSGISPVDKDETIEIYTFMEAANESARQGGKPVKTKDVYNKALKKAPVIR